MTSLSSQVAAVPPGNTVRGDAFFYRFAIFMTALVFSGFILNAVFNSGEIDRFTIWIFLHGLFSAAWYLLVLNQLRLVRRNQIATHRLMGKLSVFVFSGFLVSGYFMTVDLFHAIVDSSELGLSDPETRAAAGQAMGGITLQFILSTSLYVLGLLNLRNPIHHKRFMIATLIQMSPAAISRLAGLAGAPGSIALPIVLLLYLFIMVHDWRTDRRIHWSTLVALGIFLILPVCFFTVFSSQAWGDFIVQIMGAQPPA